jgi:predicted nucleic acid-binding protein
MLQQVSRDIVPDMPNRFYAATALHLDFPLLTYDEKIRKLESIVCLH